MKGEALEQSMLFQWCELQKGKYPMLSLLFAIPNGGSRHRLEAINLKKQGLKSGVPDIFLPYANKKYHGLFIELKYGKNKASEKQKAWINELNHQGYYAKVCVGFEEAKNTILEYINL
ncbi:VRR-NUC domain-containing protein [Romboutsia ilealis]|uniref:VRR-NUC domain-containing protein n=1 Tax=Romboutsia ilealis TaxID=1115758 RepID=UPI0023F5928B|nr:VRR-NUC domain-containing protein [Romboutsia ilealis]